MSPHLGKRNQSKPITFEKEYVKSVETQRIFSQKVDIFVIENWNTRIAYENASLTLQVQKVFNDLTDTILAFVTNVKDVLHAVDDRQGVGSAKGCSATQNLNRILEATG